MNEVKIFNFNLFKLRSKTISGEQWYVMNDVAEILDVKNPRDVIRRLDDDEKGVDYFDTPGGMQKMNIVTESGVYAFIAASKKPEAESAKRWLRKEVLPSIRKNGGYQMKPMSTIQLLETEFQAIKEVTEDQKALRGEMTELKENFGLPNDYRKRWTKVRNKRVMDVMGGYYGTAYGNKKLRSAVFREMSHSLKDHFNIDEYPTLPLSKFDEAIRRTENWKPSEVTGLAIDGANAQSLLEA